MTKRARLIVTRLENRETPATLVAGFAEQTMASGLSFPTSMAIAPDGKLFITEQAGTCEIWQNNTRLEANFFANVPITTTTTSERGLLGLAFDPNYSKNRFVYVYYTTTSDFHNRISRFKADVNGRLALTLAQDPEGGERILVDLDPHSAGNHNGGAIHFGPDGKLYVATGDNANGANSQLLTNRHGKILRYNSDGTIPGVVPDPNPNPSSFPGITGTTAGANRAIWAVGLRNPFTTAFDPVTGRFHINDVGSGGSGAGGFGSFEEINLGGAGLNYGWPSSEGTPPAANQNPNHTYPVHSYPRTVGTTIAGGAFYRPANVMFPNSYVGDYFFADYGSGWIKSLDLTTGVVTNLATSGASGPVDLDVHPDGSLYYTSIFSGIVSRIYSAPRVVDTRVNDGAIQRSRVTSVSLTFNAIVNIPNLANAFSISRVNGGAVGFTPSASVVNGVTVVTLTDFTGAETEGYLSGPQSLRDGRYILTGFANQILNGALTLDGNGDGVGTAGDNFVFDNAQGFFRLFGDFNADRKVDGLDFGTFVTTYNVNSGLPGYLSYFDFNGDGKVDGLDFGALLQRYNQPLP